MKILLIMVLMSPLLSLSKKSDKFYSGVLTLLSDTQYSHLISNLGDIKSRRIHSSGKYGIREFILVERGVSVPTDSGSLLRVESNQNLMTIGMPKDICEVIKKYDVNGGYPCVEIRVLTKAVPFKVVADYDMHRFLVDIGGQLSETKYPCLVEYFGSTIFTKWGKDLGWKVRNNRVINWVKMTDHTFTLKGEKPSYTFYFDARTKKYLHEVKVIPGGTSGDFCPNPLRVFD